MKKGWRILALLLTLIVLLGGYIYLKKKPKKDDTAKTTEKTIEVLRLDKTKVNKVILNTSDEEITLEKKDDTWKASGKEYPITQSVPQSIADTLTALDANGIVEENASDLDKYGLKAPSVSATAVVDGGEQKIVEIGDKVPGGDNYYMKLNDSNKVYTLTASTAESFKVTLSDLRADSLPVIDTTKLKSLKITRADGKTWEIRKNDTNEDTVGSEYVIYDYFSYPVEAGTTDFDSFIQSASTLSIAGYAEDNVTDLSKYGLDKPVSQLTIQDDKNTMTMIIGKDKDATHVYFKTPESNSVYLGDKASIEAITNTSALPIASKFAYIVNIDNVDSIEVKSPTDTYNITLTRQTKKAEKEGEEDEVVTTYKINNKEVEEGKFKDFYQKLIGLTIDSENDKNISVNPDVTMTFHLNKGKDKVVTVNYTPYNENFYVIHKNGLSAFLISKDKVNNLLDEIKQFNK